MKQFLQALPNIFIFLSLSIICLSMIVMINEQSVTNKLLTVLIKQNKTPDGAQNEKN